METRVADVAAVVEATRRACRNVSDMSLVGLRFGAMLAALAASRLNNVDRLVMWDPVIDGEPYAQSLLRINLAAQLAAYKKVIEGREKLLERLAGGGTVNIEGYGLTGSFVRAGVVGPPRGPSWPRTPGRLLILQPGPEGTAPRPDICGLQDGKARCRRPRRAGAAVLEGDEDVLPACRRVLARHNRVAGGRRMTRVSCVSFPNRQGVSTCRHPARAGSLHPRGTSASCSCPPGSRGASGRTGCT